MCPENDADLQQVIIQPIRLVRTTVVLTCRHTVEQSMWATGLGMTRQLTLASLRSLHSG
jgi:hypothetical protein